MNIINSMEAQEVFITHQLPTGTAFGVRVDNGEAVFINSKLAKKHAVVEEQVLTLTLIQNNKADTPWQAIGGPTPDQTIARRMVESTPRVEIADLEDCIERHFKRTANQAASTAAALAEKIGVEVTQMQTALSRMHNAGQMTKAQVHCRGGQDKASWVLWSPDASWYDMSVALEEYDE
tara:strand:+ start:2014 stop:2547 length:534 start_codon:yes stop_codon:yes gene_type:complete